MEKIGEFGAGHEVAKIYSKGENMLTFSRLADLKKIWIGKIPRENSYLMEKVHQNSKNWNWLGAQKLIVIQIKFDAWRLQKLN